MKKGIILECKEQYTYVLCKNGKMKRIKREYNHEAGKEIQIHSLSITKIISLVMVSCAVIITVLLNPFQKNTEIKALSYVSLSVNPGLVLKVDENQTITAVSYTNKDGERLVNQINFIDKTLDDSVKLFLDYCFDNHYFTNNNKIDINVMSDDQKQIQHLEKQVQEMISKYLQHHQVSISIQIDKVTSTQQEEARELGIPDSKIKLIDLVQKYYPHHSKEHLSKQSIDDLVDYLEDTGYDENLLDQLEEKLEEDHEEDDHDNHKHHDDD